MRTNVVAEYYEGFHLEAANAYLPKTCGDLTDQEQDMVSACKFFLFEFTRNYTKLAMLAIKVYLGKNIQEKKLPPVGTEPGILVLWDLLCYTLIPNWLS